MKAAFKTAICLSVALLCLLSPLAATAQGGVETADLKQIADGILAAKWGISDSHPVQDALNGTLSAHAGSAEWYLLGLAQNGQRYDFSAYEQALETYLSDSNRVHSATTRQKYALALISMGSDSAYISKTLNETVGQLGIMSEVFGLHLLNNGYEAPGHTVESLKAHLLSLRLPDGGWALSGTVSSVDVTAMTVQALAPLYLAADEDVREAVDGALEFLSQSQQADGDYTAYGVANPESAAQVMAALATLNIDFEDDPRFVKNGNTLLDGMLKYRLADGGFCHTEGGTFSEAATEQVFFALSAAMRAEAGNGSIYLLDRRSPESVLPYTPEETEQTAGEGSSPSTAEPIGQDKTEQQPTNPKLWLCLAILAAGAIGCLILFLSGRRTGKSYLAVLTVTSVLAVAVCFLDIKTKDDYYHGQAVTKENAIGTVTLTIRCDAVAGKTDSAYIPADGIILDVTAFEIAEGDTVYDILTDASQSHLIPIDADAAYVRGINHLYEFDHGELSGWMYFVNGESPSVGSGSYRLSDGDRIEWVYTLELGKDLS